MNVKLNRLSGSKNKQQSNSLQYKRKLLCWSDFSLATTGFGTVTKHIINAIHNTGLYEIDHLAINFYGEFYDKKEVPYTVIPSRLDNPQDPYGSQMFINALQNKDYDLVFICNDTFVVEEVAKHINEIKDLKKQKKQTVFKLIYYYPVDCRLLPEASTMVKVADRSVAYTNFAKQSSLDIGVKCTDVIYHGADVKNYFPIGEEERRACRKQYLGVDSDDTFVWVTANRNNPRKDIAKTLMAFVEFKNKICDNSKLYAHTKLVDNYGNGAGSDLRPLINELKVDITKDIIFPNKYSVAKGFPVNVVNQLINCGDAFITNNLGEGWGLCLDSSTIIDTCRGSIPIKNVLIGDEVISQDGKFHKVLNTTSRYIDEIYKVRTFYSDDILVTKEHPFYIKRGNTEPKWISIQDIKLDDFIAMPKVKENEPIPKTIDIIDYIELTPGLEYNEEFVWYKMGYSPFKNGLSITDIQNKFGVTKRVAEDARNCVLDKSLPGRGLPNSLAYSIAQKIKEENSTVNTQQLKIKRYIPITDEFLYFIGWYLAEGSNGKGSKIDIDMSIDKYENAVQLGKYLDDVFGIRSIVEQNGKNKCRVRASGTALSKLLGELCGIHAENKKIPSFLLKSPKSLGQLVKSYIQGDGHTNENKRYLQFSSASSSLAYQLRYICAANNILVSIAKRKTKTKDAYSGSISRFSLEKYNAFTKQNLQWKLPKCLNKSNIIHYMEDDNFFYMRVKKIEKITNKERRVYDLHVQDCHSFMANGLLAHNTLTNSMAAGVPVVSPNHTSAPEILGFNGPEEEVRGYSIECKERCYIDLSGSRPLSRMEDILSVMEVVYKDWLASKDQGDPEYIKERKNYRNNLIQRGSTWVKKHSWENICKEWIKLFNQTYHTKVTNNINGEII